MDLTEDDILQLLKIIDESDFERLSLETKDLKLVLSRSGDESSIQEVRKTESRRIPTGPPKEVVSQEEAPPESKKEPSVDLPSVVEEEGLVPIMAPVLGIFYTTPRPGDPPFVEEGSSVTEHDTVCIIEVMKVFNSVEAGVRGKVAKVCVEHGQMVESGQTLFLIRPEDEKE